MRYVIMGSPDPGERNSYFTSKISPRIGKRVRVGGRRYEVVDIELLETESKDDPLEVRAAVRRID
jgi:hypothetical protein